MLLVHICKIMFVVFENRLTILVQIAQSKIGATLPIHKGVMV